MNPLHTLLPATATITGLLIASTSQAALVPYVENFDGQTLGSAAPVDNESLTYTENPAGDFTVIDAGGGDNVYRFSYDDGNTRSPGSTFAVDAVDRPAAGFVFSTEFDVTALSGGSGSTSRVGLGVLGDTAGFGGDYYLADYIVKGGNVGEFRIAEEGSNGSQLVTSSSTFSFDAADTYELVLTGAYDSNDDLTLSLQVFNLTDSTSSDAISTVALDMPLAGDNFGIRNSVQRNNPTFTVDYANLSLTAIPEPASLSALVGLGLLAVRRRR
jgi:hypothetical protein